MTGVLDTSLPATFQDKAKQFLFHFPCSIRSFIIHKVFVVGHMTMFSFLPWLITGTGLLAMAQPTVFLIRHGEKPDSGSGLSPQGVQRAQCLRDVFGNKSSYDIRHIMAETPQPGKNHISIAHLSDTDQTQMARNNVRTTRYCLSARTLVYQSMYLAIVTIKTVWQK